ncbi:MAG: FHA domain-containing protein [Pseudomonadota bacterium]
MVAPVIRVTTEGTTSRLIHPTASRVRIGRALDNDIVLDDPYVDPYHAILDTREPGRWQFTDLKSRNGSREGRRSIENGTLESGALLTLGKSQLQVFSRDHHTDPALSLYDLEHRLISHDGIKLMIGLLCVLAAVSALSLFTRYDGSEVRLENIITIVAGALFAPVIVAGFWALIAKLLRGHSRFRALVNITLVALTVPLVVEPLLYTLYFNLPGASSLNLLVTSLNIAIGGAYLYIVLTIATALSPRIRQFSTATVMVAAVLMLVITQWSSRDEFDHKPGYDGRLMHPALLVRSGMSNDEFMTSLPSVFEHADGLVQEP